MKNTMTFPPHEIPLDNRQPRINWQAEIDPTVSFLICSCITMAGAFSILFV